MRSFRRLKPIGRLRKARPVLRLGWPRWGVLVLAVFYLLIRLGDLMMLQRHALATDDGRHALHRNGQDQERDSYETNKAFEHRR